MVRQFIGSHPERDRFPSTSVNRTTTFETEVIVGSREFPAVITFMSEEEADFEIRQSVSGALLRAIDASCSDSDVAKAFLERSDMRFRLKYLLGDWPADEVDDDPFGQFHKAGLVADESRVGLIEPGSAAGPDRAGGGAVAPPSRASNVWSGLLRARAIRSAISEVTGASAFSIARKRRSLTRISWANSFCVAARSR